MQQICEPTFEFDPVLLSIPLDFIQQGWAFDIRWYALAYIAGLLIGWRYMVALARRPKLWVPRAGKPKGSPFDEEDVDDLLLWATIGVIGGGRLGYVLFYQFDALWERPLWVITGITEGGMSFHGGLIGVGLALWLTARARKLDLWRITDAAAIVAPIGLFFGRLANFVNGELWGRVTDVPWAMRFANDRLCALRHPSQLYEAALEGVLIFAVVNVLTWQFRSLSRPGLNTGAFLLVYGLSRAFLETVREPDAHMPEALQGYVTMGMLLSIPMIFAGAWLIRRALTSDPAPAPAKAVAAK
ncbi:MAG: prolipoprotein diacylglyceryl transferase [Rhodobacterales bacterium CG15_BIG_FIL_POST_REV_8_21_14_020_59_13]|nr:MAG: prolipoprotein diacylglyceryl transferase [Rhodobacterales bacterium CG15_BIG_FIL_POST_REV_8_21_14_020_59_13]